MPYICLHKSEWNRLKSQAETPKTPRKEENKYVENLIEQSQKWIKSWPDTFEGQVQLLQKRQKKDPKQEVVAFSALHQLKKHDNVKQAIAKARQLIFESSSYGKQLLSALLASKELEEREAQIAFKKEIAMKDELEKLRDKEGIYFGKVDQEEQKQLRKKKNVLFAEENKCMYEKLNAKIKKEKAEEARGAREDALLMQTLLDWEKQEEEKVRKCQEDQLQKYNKEQQDFKEAKLKRDIENDAKIEKAKKEYERKLVRIRETQKQIILNNSKSEAMEQNYKILEKIEEEKRKRFEDFLNKREKEEAMTTKMQQEDISRQHPRHEAKKQLSKQYKKAAEERRNNINIITCDRQCLIVKPHRGRSKHYSNGLKKLAQCMPAKCDQPDPKPLDKKLQFLSPQKKLIEELRQREKVPSPWTGTKGAHAQFAEEAGRVLAECKHKAMARKVIDEYRRMNRLDATTLPVKNY